MSDIVAKIKVKVHLVSGKEMTHTYSPPESKKEMEKFIDDIIDRTFTLNPLLRDKTRYLGYLWFNNPNITYNPDNVEGIEVSTIGIKEIEEINEAMKKAQARIGYIKD